MDQDVVDDPARHHLQPVRQPDHSRARGAGSPPLLLVGHPADRGRFRPVAERRGQMSVRQPDGAGQQLVVAARRRRPRLAVQHLPDHVTDEDLLVGFRHPLRDQHHDRVAVPVGRHGPLPARAAPHLDLGLRARPHRGPAERADSSATAPASAPAQRTPQSLDFCSSRPPPREVSTAGDGSAGADRPPSTVHHARVHILSTPLSTTSGQPGRPGFDSATRRRLAFRARNLQMVGTLAGEGKRC